MSKPNPYIVEIMRQEIRQVRRQVWSGQRDRVCNPSTERKLHAAHEASSFEQAQRCQETYLETARRRLKRYLETGEILSA